MVFWVSWGILLNITYSSTGDRTYPVAHFAIFPCIYSLPHRSRKYLASYSSWYFCKLLRLTGGGLKRKQRPFLNLSPTPTACQHLTHSRTHKTQSYPPAFIIIFAPSFTSYKWTDFRVFFIFLWSNLANTEQITSCIDLKQKNVWTRCPTVGFSYMITTVRAFGNKH